ncbi:MAG TPA: AAA family ATPase [Abditibacteriaceae bacterium]|jgi:predicted ATPase
MIYLAAISKKGAVRDDTFPFNVPTIRALERIEFKQPVTFLVGENGSGKSTLLEAIAAGAASIVVGGEDIERDESLEHARLLAAQLRFSWRKKTGRGFFLRAEDFFNFSKRINRTGQELQDIVAGYEAELEHNPDDMGLRRAIGSIRGQKAALTSRYGDLDANSHGEGFMKLFESRLMPNGLYLLDEPEAALSPIRQLSLLSMVKQMVGQGCQFIIATHSPILMAFPAASILSFDAQPVTEVAYEDLEHVRLTKAFLSDPAAFLRRL